MKKRETLTLDAVRQRRLNKIEAREYVKRLQGDFLVKDWKRQWEVCIELNRTLGDFVQLMDFAVASWIKNTSHYLSDIEQTIIVRERAEKFYQDKGI